MEERKKPQVLLLGNGLNRAYAGNDWSGLIKAILQNPKVTFETIKDMPFPLQAVIASDDHVDRAIKDHKEAFLGAENIESMRPSAERILSIPFDHILTTNYSYELERVADPGISRSGEECAKIMAHTEKVDRAEAKYPLHTYNTVEFNGHIHKIWHIHGEARKAQSIMLGHYYYGKLLGKYQKELEESENKQYKRQQEGKPILQDSWLDAFIMGDVYVLGFGFDFSEMDLWWLLNRKKREKAEHGRVFFYEPSYGNELKESLLEVYDVKVIDLDFREEMNDAGYPSFYDAAIDHIGRTVMKNQ